MLLAIAGAIMYWAFVKQRRSFRNRSLIECLWGGGEAVRCASRSNTSNPTACWHHIKLFLSGVNRDRIFINSQDLRCYATSLLKPALAAEFQLLSAGVIESKTTRDADGAYVLEQVIKGKVHEIGFGAITEILLYAGKGLKLVGPLPADIQNYTSYTAAPLASSQQPALAQQFVVFLSGPVGKPLFVAAGVTD
jgi:hypothetical protein